MIENLITRIFALLLTQRGQYTQTNKNLERFVIDSFFSTKCKPISRSTIYHNSLRLHKITKIKTLKITSTKSTDLKFEHRSIVSNQSKYHVCEAIVRVHSWPATRDFLREGIHGIEQFQFIWCNLQKHPFKPTYKYLPTYLYHGHLSNLIIPTIITLNQFVPWKVGELKFIVSTQSR